MHFCRGACAICNAPNSILQLPDIRWDSSSMLGFKTISCLSNEGVKWLDNWPLPVFLPRRAQKSVRFPADDGQAALDINYDHLGQISNVSFFGWHSHFSFFSTFGFLSDRCAKSLLDELGNLQQWNTFSIFALKHNISKGPRKLSGDFAFSTIKNSFWYKNFWKFWKENIASYHVISRALK